MRFNNGLTIVDITAADLANLIEHGVSGLPDQAGRFPQVGNLRFSFDPSGTASTAILDGTNTVIGYTAGTRLVNLVVTNDDGSIKDVVVDTGVLQGDPGHTFRMVILNFLAGEGDDYLVPDTNRLDLTGNAPNDPGAADFAESGTEQDALAEYLAATYPDSGTPFGEAETDATEDTRIQDVTQRADTVLP